MTGYAVLKLSEDLIHKMRDFYGDRLSAAAPPGSVFRAQADGCAITAYRTGKVLFQGKRAEEEVKMWRAFAEAAENPFADQEGHGERTDANEENGKRGREDRPSPTDGPSLDEASAPIAAINRHDYMPPKTVARLAIIGSDEVGTGDYFGPVVVCATYSGPEHVERLDALGVRDSKRLTDERIRALAEEIGRIVPYSLLVLDNDKYNRLIRRGYNQTKLKAVLHNQALVNVRRKIGDRTVHGFLVDQFTPPAQYFKAIADRPEKADAPIYFQTNAESLHPAVACASIIARYRFLQEIDRLSERCGMTLPKGAGPGVDEAAARLIRQRGETFLSRVAKLHFANTEKARKLAEKSR